jgi:hypothetical protein
MADKFLNERTALVMAGMERSCALLADWMTNHRLRTTEMLENLPMREDR